MIFFPAIKFEKCQDTPRQVIHVYVKGLGRGWGSVDVHTV